ncbi:MAG TPA: GYD domain-containing protein [candidate division Zixibacteria bacterium]|nr:GYD domain-containing protein [candidate division Zixibacteria bacterium]
MATFIMALQINAGAKKVHDDLSAQINDSLEIFSKNNVKISNLFATLGRYDYLAIFEAADQTLAFRVASEINNKGILETETWPVIPYDEFTQLFSR